MIGHLKFRSAQQRFSCFGGSSKNDWQSLLDNKPESSNGATRSDVKRRAHDHLVMIRAHLQSINRITIAGAKGDLVGPWLLLGARQAHLDIRFVVEEMMLLSVAAHHQAGERISKKLRKAYQAGIVAKELAQLNPNYFPIAISVIDIDEPDVAGQFVIREGKHLTDALAVEYWNKAGAILHANSHTLLQGKISDHLAQAKEFLDLTISLLETFEVDVSGNGMWIGGHLNFDAAQGPQVLYAHLTQ